MKFETISFNNTESYQNQLKRIKNELDNADAVLIGAGAGLSTSAGLTYSGERFYKYFSDFAEKYGITDMYSGGFYPFKSLEEFWAWWSRHILVNRYQKTPKPVYENLYNLVKGKNYFVLTTNVDHCFQKAGFEKQRLFYTQGDYGLFQCSRACHDKTYDNRDIILRMAADQKNMKIPTELIPRCPVCGAPMTTNLRCDDKFVEDKGWHEAAKRYDEFIKNASDKRLLLLELGVGANTPVIIKYPFWKLAEKNPNATYVCVNLGESYCPTELENQSVCVNSDIAQVIEDLLS